MTGVLDAGSMRVLLAGPSVLRTFAFALVGRLNYGVLPLCFLFTVRDASGSFAIAAASSATLGFATLTMPVQARLVDRYGQRRVLPIYTTCYSGLLVLAAVLAQGVTRPAVWFGVGLLLGLTSPALGPATRAQWREIAPEGPQLRRAYSLDSVCEESLYLVGPVVAGVVLAVGPAWVGLLLGAGLIVCGTIALAASPYRPPVTRSPGPGESVRPASPRGAALRPLLGLLGSMSLFGAGSAATFVAIAALADRTGSPQVAGIVEAAMAVGAVAGGLLWARFGAGEPSPSVLAVLLVSLALAQALTAGVTAYVVLVGAVLAVGSLTTSPVYVLAFSTADSMVPPEQRTEASTWVTVGTNAGISAGMAVAGVTAAASGAAPFLLAAALSAAAAGIAALRAKRRTAACDVLGP